MMATISEEEKRKSAARNTLSPSETPPQSLRMPQRQNQGIRPRSEMGSREAQTRARAERERFGAYWSWFAAPPGAFSAPPEARLGQTTAAPPEEPPAPRSARPRERTKTAPSPVGYSMENVPQGGGYISWDAPMGEKTLSRLAPEQRDQFRKPGSISITPKMAKELAGRVNTLPADEFLRMMAPNPQAITEARNRAMNRGDYAAVERSYLSPEERQAEDERRWQAEAENAERVSLESMATAPISLRQSWGERATTARNRRFAADRLRQIANQRASSGDAEQQAFDNEIAMMNALANRDRASASLNRPGRRSIFRMKQYDESGFVTGEGPPMLFDPDKGTLTPMVPELSATRAPEIIQGKDGKQYMPDPARPGKYLVWRE